MGPNRFPLSQNSSPAEQFCLGYSPHSYASLFPYVAAMQNSRGYSPKHNPLLPGLSTEDKVEKPSKIIKVTPEPTMNPEPDSKKETETKPLSDFVL